MESKQNYYASHMSEWQSSGVLDDAEKLVEKTPLARYAVLIPVAAHQESPVIYHALGEYARQQAAEDFTVVLNMNWPVDADEEAVKRCYAELDRARQDFPHLDLRTISHEYPAGTPMGTIRGDLWDTVIAADKENYDAGNQSELFIINHDIDTEKVPYMTMSNIQKNISASKKYTADNEIVHTTSTPMLHSLDPNLPNSSRAVRWMDTVFHLMQGPYDAALIIPATRYTSAGGMDRESMIGEVQGMLKSNGIGDSGLNQIRNPAIITSGRRAIGRVAAGHGIEGIWEDGTFHNTDIYREEELAQTDIDDDELYFAVEEFADNNLHVSLFVSTLVALEKEKVRQEGTDRPANRISISNIDFDFLSKNNKPIRQSLFRTAKIAHRVLDSCVEHPNADVIVSRALKKVADSID